MSFLNRIFLLDAHGTTVRREVVAGATTFAAMAYILAVNPAILATTGMDREALLTATALAATFGCFAMAALTNFPIALAPGMGLNAYFAFVICIGHEIPWQGALALVFWNGILFLLLSVTGFRTALADALPPGLKIGIQCGIGFFIAFVGLKEAGLIVSDAATFVRIGEIATPGALLVLGGIVLTAFLVLKQVPGGILIAILTISALGILLPGADGEPITQRPGGIVSAPHGISEIFLRLDWWFPLRSFGETWTLLLTLLMLDLFDSIGTLVGVSQRANLVDAEGKMPKMGRALTADACATVGGALLGTSTTTSFVESAAGVEAGGRTGLTSFVTGLCFLLALVFTPIFMVIPAVATAPAVVMVGVLMAQGLKHLKFDDLNEVTPAVVTMLLIPLTFSITEGIGIGMLVHVSLMALQGRFRETPPLTWVIAGLFVLYYAAA